MSPSFAHYQAIQQFQCSQVISFSNIFWGIFFRILPVFLILSGWTQMDLKLFLMRLAIYSSEWLGKLLPGYCLHRFTLQHATSTSLSGKNKSTNPTADGTGDAKESAETGSGEDESSGEDTDDEDDALLTKQLNKQRKRAMAAALGRRRPLTSRNAYKDKGKGTMNSKIQKQACQWWMVGLVRS